MGQPERDDRITVVPPVRVNGGPQTFRTIVGDQGSGEFTWTYVEVDHYSSLPAENGDTGARWEVVVQFADEGRTWARGWDTPAADALRAAVALTRDA